MASGFTIDMGEMKARLASFDLKVHGAISLAVDYTATAGEAEMKATARWTDRTTAARSGLHTATFHEIERWTMVFAHAVSYGIWLETRRDFHGRYAIILEQVERSGNALMRTLDGLFRKI